MKTYVADFETRAGNAAISEKRTYVWAWAIANLDKSEDVSTGNTIHNFMNYIKKLGNCTIYFHNLKFDGNFIIDYLLRHGFNHANDRPKKGEFGTVISDTGVWYEITINFGSRCYITIRDSLKKLPFTVRQIGEGFKTEHRKLDIEYETERPERYVMTDQERNYVINDVLVVREALKMQYDNGMEKTTIGADCLNSYIKMLGGKDNFRRLFPFLDAEQDEFVRKSYKGGWCYVNRPGHHTEVDGHTADVNSLYPFMMHSSSGNYYPIGDGEYYKGGYEYDIQKPLFVQRVLVEFKLKTGYVPTIQVKGNLLYRPNEWIRETVEPLELTLTKPDLETLVEHYDIISMTYIDGYKYACGKGLFDDYINYYADIKANSKGAKRQLAKLFLNNLYGKFATKIERCNKIPYLGEDNLLHFKLGEVEDSNAVYIPIGAYITAYARQYTIRAAQRNYDIFCYADTDSIHCTAEPVGIEIHDSRLGAWKIESRWTEAKFVRQKTYAELTPDGWDIKCAGMPEEAKDIFRGYLSDGSKTIDDFDIGLSISGGKLRPVQAFGGVVLTPTDFTMREGYFFQF